MFLFAIIQYIFVSCFVLCSAHPEKMWAVYICLMNSKIFYELETCTVGETAQDFCRESNRNRSVQDAWSVHILLVVTRKTASARRLRRSLFLTEWRLPRLSWREPWCLSKRQPWCVSMIARCGEAFDNITSWQRLPNSQCDRSADHFSWRFLLPSPPIQCIQSFVSGRQCLLLECTFGMRSSSFRRRHRQKQRNRLDLQNPCKVVFHLSCLLVGIPVVDRCLPRTPNWL